MSACLPIVYRARRSRWPRVASVLTVVAVSWIVLPQVHGQDQDSVVTVSLPPVQKSVNAVLSSATPVDPLSLARKRVEQYFQNFSDVTCKEAVTQLILNSSGRTIYRESSSYDYQFEANTQTGALKFLETREPRGTAFRDPGRTLLVTTGFASLLLIADPLYESSYVFGPPGTENLGGVTYKTIHFTPVPGGASPASLRLRGRSYALPLSGTIWIDPQSGAIVKLEAEVGSSLSDLGLAGMRMEVHYAPHEFHNPDESVWVVDSAMIDVETPHQHWRNVHHFSDYKRFNVDVHEEISKLP